MSWSQEQSSLLIELYRKFPCLYVMKHKDYHNKHKRRLALSTIVEELQMLRPNATEHEVQKKFLALRTTYLVERKKVLQSLHSGMGGDEVYQPTLWYYKDLSFLNEHLQMRVSKSNLQMQEFEAEETQTQDYDPNSHHHDSDVEFNEVVEVDLGEDVTLLTVRGDSTQRSSHGILDYTPSTSRSRSSSSSSGLPSKRRKISQRKQENEEVVTLKCLSERLDRLQENIPQPKAEEDIVGEYIASQLKQIKNLELKRDLQLEFHKMLRAALRE